MKLTYSVTYLYLQKFSHQITSRNSEKTIKSHIGMENTKLCKFTFFLKVPHFFYVSGISSSRLSKLCKFQIIPLTLNTTVFYIEMIAFPNNIKCRSHHLKGYFTHFPSSRIYVYKKYHFSYVGCFFNQ